MKELDKVRKNGYAETTRNFKRGCAVAVPVFS
jgi:DNA-binding IclR family transcriptional regulator